MIEFTPPETVSLVGPFALSSHGVAFLIGCLVSYFATRWRTPARYHRDLEDVLPMMTVGAIIGARSLYVLQNPDLWTQPLKALAVWEGGLVSYGGMVGALVAWFLFLRYRQLPVAQMCDALAPTALVGWAIGRIGCLLSWYGENGKLTDVPWAFVVDGEARHPVMLYISLGLVLSAVLVIYLEKLGWRPSATAFIAYGTVRIVADFFRDYDPGWLIYTSQGFCLLLVVFGGFVLKLGGSVRPWPENHNVPVTTSQ